MQIELITFSFFVRVHAKEIGITQNANVKQIQFNQYHSITMDRESLEYHLICNPPSYL